MNTRILTRARCVRACIGRARLGRTQLWTRASSRPRTLAFAPADQKWIQVEIRAYY